MELSSWRHNNPSCASENVPSDVVQPKSSDLMKPTAILILGSTNAENGGVMATGDVLPTEEIQTSVSSNNNGISFVQAIMGGQTTEQQQLPPCSMPQNNSNSSQFQIQASVSSNSNELPFIQAVLNGQPSEQQQLPLQQNNSNQFQIQASVASNNNDVPFIQTLGGPTMEQQQLPPQNNSNSSQFQIQAQHQCSFMQYSAPQTCMPFQQNQYQRSFMQYSAPPPPPPYMPQQSQYQRSFMQYSAPQPPPPYMPLQQSQYQRSFMQYSAPPTYMQFQQNQYQQPLPNIGPCPQTMVQQGPTGYVNNAPPVATAPNPHCLRGGMGNMQRLPLPSCSAIRGNIKAPSKGVTATTTSKTSSLAKGLPLPNYAASSNPPGGLEILWREISGECQKLFTPQDIPDSARIRGYFTVYELLILKRTLESRFLGHDVKPLTCASDPPTGSLKKRNKRKQTGGENTPKKKAEIQNTDQQ